MNFNRFILISGSLVALFLGNAAYASKEGKGDFKGEGDAAPIAARVSPSSAGSPLSASEDPKVFSGAAWKDFLQKNPGYKSRIIKEALKFKDKTGPVKNGYASEDYPYLWALRDVFAQEYQEVFVKAAVAATKWEKSQSGKSAMVEAINFAFRGEQQAWVKFMESKSLQDFLSMITDWRIKDFGGIIMRTGEPLTFFRQMY